MPFTPVTIVGTITRPDGTSAEGEFTATLTEPMVNGTTIILPTPITGQLTSGGPVNTSGLPFILEANDDPATTPAGAAYEFTFELDNAPVDPFTAVITHSAPGGQVNLATLIPTVP